MLSIFYDITQTSPPATLEVNQFNQPPRRERQSDDNALIVLRDPREANAKLVTAKAEDEVVAAIMALATTKPVLMSALVDCVCTDDTAKAISNRYSLHQSTLSYWNRQVGLPKRRRGRRALLQPTAEHKQILELVRNHGISGAARRASISKQRVSQIVCRWAPELKGRRRATKSVALPHPTQTRNV